MTAEAPLSHSTLELSPSRESAVDVLDLGRVPYREAVVIQEDLAERRRAEDIPDTLLLLEHPPTITLGRRATLDDVYLSPAELTKRGIALEKSTRGGLVTYHGPGQLVGYPIVKLRARGLTVPCYVRALELAIIEALGELGIAAHVHETHVGVWTDRGKIAAIGVAQRHGVSMHGFAINLQPDLSHFDLINPCGIADLGVTSASAILGHPVDIQQFKQMIARTSVAELGDARCRTAPVDN
jgi:lipoate-protein ligase B